MIFQNLLEKLSGWKPQRLFASMGLFDLIFTLLGIGLAVVVVDYAYMLHMRSKMPPGPFPLPIIGNTFSLPDKKPWIYFEELAQQYNAPLITFWIGR